MPGTVLDDAVDIKTAKVLPAISVSQDQLGGAEVTQTAPESQHPSTTCLYCSGKDSSGDCPGQAFPVQ